MAEGAEIMDTRRDQAEGREPLGPTLAFVAVAAAVAVVLRVAPRWLDPSGTGQFVWNLMPVGALGLFAGVRLRSRWAYLVPVLVMLASDLLLIRPLAQQGYSAFSWYRPVLYASFALYPVLGRLARRFGWPWSVVAGCGLGSLQFFLVSNFLVWLAGDGRPYAMTVGGLVECYTFALPFLRNTAAGDLLYTGLLFGLYAVLVTLPQREKASQPA
jgi:hypothetical protein